MKIYYLFIFTLYFFVLPISAVIFFEKYKSLFRKCRWILWLVGYSIISWGVVLSAIYIPYWLGFYVIRGPELGFAVVFGWLYLWITSIPVFLLALIYFLLRSKK